MADKTLDYNVKEHTEIFTGKASSTERKNV